MFFTRTKEDPQSFVRLPARQVVDMADAEIERIEGIVRARQEEYLEKNRRRRIRLRKAWKFIEIYRESAKEFEARIYRTWGRRLMAFADYPQGAWQLGKLRRVRELAMLATRRGPAANVFICGEDAQLLA